MAYARAHKVPVIDGQGAADLYYEGALNVAWVNGLLLLGPVDASRVLFCGQDASYAPAWLLSAAVAALFATVPLSKLGR